MVEAENGVDHSVLGCAMRSTYRGCRGGELDAHLAYTITYNDQPLKKNSVFHISEKS